MRLLATHIAFQQPFDTPCSPCSSFAPRQRGLLLLLVRASTPASCALLHRLLEPGRALLQGLLKL